MGRPPGCAQGYGEGADGGNVTAANPKAVDLLAEAIWKWALIPLRAHRIDCAPDPQSTAKTIRTFHIKPLATDEMHTFMRACAQLQEAADAKALEASELARMVIDAIEQGARSAEDAEIAKRVRLEPRKRREYRDRAHAAQGLAIWLSSELMERQPVSREEGPITFFSKDPAAGLDVHAIADMLVQKLWAPLHADAKGALTGGGPTAPEISRAVELVNSLHWLAGLLREDFNRSRPTGRAAAPWKYTARNLRTVFERELGAPLLTAVASLAGLAHQCVVPLPELSRLSKG
jgi:hypothetical protein